MNLAPCSLQQLTYSAESIDSAQNYKDLLLVKSPSEINKMQFFRTMEGDGILSITPTNSINVYSDTPSISSNILDYAVNNLKLSPQTIFGNFSLDSQIKGKAKIKKHPFLYMRLQTPKLWEISNQMSFRIVKDKTDQNYINEWYKEFNTSDDASWDTPDIEALNGKKLFLFFYNDQLLGGVANTLLNAQHFWMGRFYVFPQFRKKGFGMAMMNIVESAAKLCGQSIHLLVNSDNQAAINFYKKRNYQTICENGHWQLSTSD